MIVYLCGDEPYFIRVNQLRLEKEGEVYRATELDSTALDFLQMQGFFGKHVLTLSKDSYSEKDIDKIKNLHMQDSDNCLILLGKIAKNSKFYKWLSKEGTIISSERLSEREAPTFCAKVLKSLGAEITQDAATLFMNGTGYYLKACNLYDVCNSLKQLALISPKITTDVVLSYPQSQVVNRWKLVGLLGQAPDEFMRRMVYCKRDGENTIGLLSIILRAFRIAYKVKTIGGDALKEIGLTQYQYRDIEWIVKRCSQSQIENAIAILNQGIREQKSNDNKEAAFIRALGGLIMEIR